MATEEFSVLQALVSLGFSWEILDVDNGVKPAIALTSEDVPFVAYMLEARPGFGEERCVERHGLGYRHTFHRLFLRPFGHCHRPRRCRPHFLPRP